MKFEGEINEIELLPKLVELSDERFTGALRFENDAIIKIVYFKGGDVLSASTNDRADSIDEILLRSNKVSKEHIKQALAKRKDNETLGDALLSLGFITRKELTWARRAQVIGILRSLMHWTEGTYTLVADYLPKREEGTSFHLPQLVVELLVTEEDRGRIEQVMQGGEAVFEAVPGGDEKYQKLGLNDDADSILARVDGSKSAAELAQGSSMDTFSVFKLLEAFHVLGITRHVGSSAPTLAMEVPASLEVKESLDVSFDAAPALPAEPSFGNLDLDLQGASANTRENEAIPPQKEAMPDWDSPAFQPSNEALNFDDDPPSPQRDPIPAPVVPPVRPAGRLTTTAFTANPVRKRSKAPLIVALTVLLLAALGYGGWKYFAAEPASSPVAVATRNPAPVPPATASGTEPASSSTITEIGIAATSTESASVAPSPVVPTTTVQGVTTPATATVASPVPVAIAPRPTSSDPQRARYEALAREHAAESASTPYAVQIAFVCETSSLTTALEKGGSNIWFVPAERGGRVCFRVLWGRYQDRAGANQGLSTVPQPYRAGRPSVVRVSQVVSR